MRIIVCGSRTLGTPDTSTGDVDNDWSFIFRTLDKANSQQPIVELMHGDCPTGADAIAAAWAEGNGIPVTAIPADWKKHGKSGGPIRNRTMAKSTPRKDYVIAFTDKPLEQSRGTNSMIYEAGKQGIKSHLFRVDLGTMEF